MANLFVKRYLVFSHTVESYEVNTLLNGNHRETRCAFRILLFGERRAADDETEDTLRGSLRGHSGEPRRRMRALPQTKRSAAVALGVSSRPLHDRRVHRPLVQIETHARYFRSSKCQNIPDCRKGCALELDCQKLLKSKHRSSNFKRYPYYKNSHLR